MAMRPAKQASRVCDKRLSNFLNIFFPRVHYHRGRNQLIVNCYLGRETDTIISFQTEGEHEKVCGSFYNNGEYEKNNKTKSK